MNRLLLAALGLALLASCTNEVAGLTCRTQKDCDPTSWCDDGVCVTCEPLGVPCSGPADAAEPGEDAQVIPATDAGLRPDADVAVVEDAAVVQPSDSGVSSDGGEPTLSDAGLSLDAQVVEQDAQLPGADGGVVVPLDAAVQAPDAAAPGPDAAAPGLDAGPTFTACHSAANPLKGRCRAGTSYLVDGVWGPCIGEVLPQPETCNGLDDDCDDQTDEGLFMRCGLGVCEKEVSACADGVLQTCPFPETRVAVESCDGLDNDCDGLIDEDGCACVYVDGWGGSDANPGTDPLLPVATIKTAIANAKGTTNRVCVSGGSQCSAGSVAVYTEAVVMANGVHVLGGYLKGQAVRSNTCVTQIQAPAGVMAAVSFSSLVTATTQLAGFVIRASDVDLARAVEVVGSTGALISANRISGGKGANSRGIYVNGGRPRIELNAIDGGLGVTRSTGILASASNLAVRLNCGGTGMGPVTGPPCTSDADDPTLVSFIRGRPLGSVAGAGSVGIDLTDCTGALVLQNAVGAGGAVPQAVALRMSGKVDGIVVAQNTLRAVADGAMSTGEGTYTGVMVEGCTVAGQTSPWIAANRIATSSANASSAVGVGSVGACAPRLERNDSIVGNLAGGAQVSAFGVRCEKDEVSGVASPCTVVGNTLIAGNDLSNTGSTSSLGARGIACYGGSCQTIEGNKKVTAGTGTVTIGVELVGGKAVVEANFIDGGCPQGQSNGTAMGLRTIDASARVVNNVVRGALDGCSRAFLTSTAATVEVSADSTVASNAELDLHSNDLVGGAATMAGLCTSSTLQFGNGASLARRGLVRNNILQIGGCAAAYGVRELGLLQPRVFTNNDLYGGPLYFRGAVLGTIDDVNLKVGPANVSEDPGWDTSFHLSAGKQAIATGTPDQAPDRDLYGLLRGFPYDMGAVKYGP